MTSFEKIYPVKVLDKEGVVIKEISSEELTGQKKFLEDKDWKKAKLINIRSRAAVAGIECTIEEDDIPMPTHCPVLGIELDYYGANKPKNKRGPVDNTPSLDRVVPEKGYIPGNVVVVSMRANRLKNNASLEELGKIWHFYKYYNDTSNRE